jgi:hypothetical protein
MMPAEHVIMGNGTGAGIANAKPDATSSSRERLERARAVLAIRALASQALVFRATYGTEGSPSIDSLSSYSGGRAP